MSHTHISPEMKARLIGYAVPSLGLLLWWPVWDSHIRMPIPPEAAPPLDHLVASFAWGALLVGPMVAVLLGAIIHGAYLRR